MIGDTAIAVFTRAPVPGATKTRLIPLLGADGAARAHETLLGIALREAGAACPGRVSMFVAGEARHPVLEALSARLRVPLLAQRGEHLGARMLDAITRLLSNSRNALVIGSDCPALTASAITAAAAELQRHDMVFVPAEDGGYVLVGAQGEPARLASAFTDIDWGGRDVMQATRRRLQAAGLRHAEQPACWDVDRPADWQRAVRSGLVGSIGAG